MINVPGLPEGISLVRFGIANPDEYEIIGNPLHNNDFIIVPGPRGGTVSQMVVVPSKGWRFREHYDIRLGFKIFVPVQDIEPQDFTIHFRATDTFELAQIKQAIETATFIPGFVPDV